MKNLKQDYHRKLISSTHLYCVVLARESSYNVEIQSKIAKTGNRGIRCFWPTFIHQNKIDEIYRSCENFKAR